MSRRQNTKQVGEGRERGCSVSETKWKKKAGQTATLFGRIIHSLLFRGLNAGALLFLLISCENGQHPERASHDSSFVKTAFAQPEDSGNTEDLYRSRQNAITRAVAEVSPAVVGITVTQLQRFRARRPFDDPLWQYFFPELYRDRVYERKIESLGSGFIFSEDGYIVTNQHVVENASEILVTMTDGRRFNAELIGSDHLTDIALLKIEGNHFPFIRFGRADDLLVGEWVIALGNPFGLFQLNDKPTVTVGVISAVDRDWGRTEEDRLYMDMIQTDAAINRGNSGGPLVNSLGRVIGINTFIFTGSQYSQGFVGIGFAIPIDKAREIITEILEKGEVDRKYWLGILRVQDLNPYIISALRLSVEEGIIITQLDRRGPAYRAGMRVEDVIVAVDGKTVTSRDKFVEIVNSMDLRVGDILTFELVRGNRRMTINVKLEPVQATR